MLRGELRSFTAVTSYLLKAAPLMSPEGDAVGHAEIELTRHGNGILVQEFEVDVAGLSTGALVRVLVDGERVGAFRTDSRGTAEFEQYRPRRRPLGEIGGLDRRGSAGPPG